MRLTSAVGALAFVTLSFPCTTAHSQSCIQISTIELLEGIGGSTGPLTGSYCLTKDIPARETASWNNGAGFLPIGNGTSPFSGVFDGMGHTISDLTVNSPQSFVGLFGANIGTIQNLTLANVIVIATGVGNSLNVGGLVGQNLSGALIQQSSASGAVVTTASNYLHVGGISGENDGTILSSHSTALVSAGPGFNDNGYYTFGGLVGTNFGSIQESSASGAIYGDSGDGGSFAGKNNGSINQSFANGPIMSGVGVNGGGITGGLVGWNQGGLIQQSYALGAVNAGTGRAGGLVELDDVGGQVVESYSIGWTTGQQTGGLVDRFGFGGGTASASYWDTDTSGQTQSAGGSPITDTNLKAALPSGFNSSAWGNGANDPKINTGYPYLLWQTFAPFDQAAAKLHGTKYTFVPIGQLDPAQYSVDSLTQKFNSVSSNSWAALYTSFASYRLDSSGTPYGDSTGAGVACLSTVYAMIGKAVGAANFNFPAASATIDLFQNPDGTGLWPVSKLAILSKITFTYVGHNSSTIPARTKKYFPLTPGAELSSLLSSGPLIGWDLNDSRNDPTGHFILMTGTISSGSTTYVVADDPLLGVQIRFPYSNGMLSAISHAFDPNSGRWVPFTLANAPAIKRIAHIEPERFRSNFNELCGCVFNGSSPYIPSHYEVINIAH